MRVFRKLIGKSAVSMYAPMAGMAVPISEIPDAAFADGILGNGIGIVPSEGKVYAPCDATVDMMFPDGHAVSLVSNSGAEILIHVGIDTVSMNGKAYTVHVENGDKVRKGQLLIDADLDMIIAAGRSTITPIIICNSCEYSIFEAFTGANVTENDVVIRLER